MANEAFDLDLLARKLSDDRRYSRTVRLIEEFSSATSIFQDLSTAQQSMLTMFGIQRDDEARRAFSQALMMHAVITYSRALVSRTNNRRIIDVVGKAYSKDQKTKHAAISDLRSTALAHYHKPLGPYAAQWIDDRAIVISRDGVFGPPQDVYVRKNYSKVAADALAELLETAISYIRGEIDRRREALNAALLEGRTDSNFQKTLLECKFEPDEYFPSKMAVDTFWNTDGFNTEEHVRKPPFV